MSLSIVPPLAMNLRVMVVPYIDIVRQSIEVVCFAAYWTLLLGNHTPPKSLRLQCSKTAGINDELVFKKLVVRAARPSPVLSRAASRS